MSDILEKRAMHQSRRDRYEGKMPKSKIPTSPNREEIDELVSKARSNVGAAASPHGSSSSSKHSETFHSARSYEIKSERSGRKLMSEDEVSSLVHNALRRARKATKSNSPRRRNISSPSSATFSPPSGVGSPNRHRPPTTPRTAPSSPTKALFIPKDEDIATQASMSRGTRIGFTKYTPANIEDISKPKQEFSSFDGDGSSMSLSDYQRIDSAATDESFGQPGLGTVNSSEAIIRRVEEEIANARKAAQEANRRLAGVSADLRLASSPKKSSHTASPQGSSVPGVFSAVSENMEEKYDMAMDVIGEEFKQSFEGSESRTPEDRIFSPESNEFDFSFVENKESDIPLPESQESDILFQESKESLAESKVSDIFLQESKESVAESKETDIFLQESKESLAESKVSDIFLQESKESVAESEESDIFMQESKESMAESKESDIFLQESKESVAESKESDIFSQESKESAAERKESDIFLQESKESAAESKESDIFLQESKESAAESKESDIYLQESKESGAVDRYTAEVLLTDPSMDSGKYGLSTASENTENPEGLYSLPSESVDKERYTVPGQSYDFSVDAPDDEKLSHAVSTNMDFSRQPTLSGELSLDPSNELGRSFQTDKYSRSAGPLVTKAASSGSLSYEQPQEVQDALRQLESRESESPQAMVTINDQGVAVTSMGSAEECPFLGDVVDAMDDAEEVQSDDVAAPQLENTKTHMKDDDECARDDTRSLQEEITVEEKHGSNSYEKDEKSMENCSRTSQTDETDSPSMSTNEDLHDEECDAPHDEAKPTESNDLERSYNSSFSVSADVEVESSQGDGAENRPATPTALYEVGYMDATAEAKAPSSVVSDCEADGASSCEQYPLDDPEGDLVAADSIEYTDEEFASIAECDDESTPELDLSLRTTQSELDGKASEPEMKDVGGEPRTQDEEIAEKEEGPACNAPEVSNEMVTSSRELAQEPAKLGAPALSSEDVEVETTPAQNTSLETVNVESNLVEVASSDPTNVEPLPSGPSTMETAPTELAALVALAKVSSDADPTREELTPSESAPFGLSPSDLREDYGVDYMKSDETAEEEGVPEVAETSSETPTEVAANNGPKLPGTVSTSSSIDVPEEALSLCDNPKIDLTGIGKIQKVNPLGPEALTSLKPPTPSLGREVRSYEKEREAIRGKDMEPRSLEELDTVDKRLQDRMSKPTATTRRAPSPVRAPSPQRVALVEHRRQAKSRAAEGQASKVVDEVLMSTPEEKKTVKPEVEMKEEAVVKPAESFKPGQKVRFKKRYPVPPMIAKPRAAEDIVRDNEIKPADNQLVLAQPKKDLEELLDAATGPSLPRRSNACGALKVLTTPMKNRLTVVRTKGVLDALVFAASAKLFSREMDAVVDARTRAVACILNLAEPKQNRELVFFHPGMTACLTKCIIEDIDEARASACAALATLAKTSSIREPMVKNDKLLDILSAILVGMKREPEPVDLDKPDYSADDENSLGRSVGRSFSTRSDSTSSSTDNESSNCSHDEDTVTLPTVMSMRQETMERSTQTTRRAQMSTCAVLMHLSKQCGATSFLLANYNLMDALVTMALRADDPIHTKCLEILCNLTRFPENNEAMAKYPGLVDALVVSGNSQMQLDRVWALRTLQNLSSNVVGKTVLANAVVLELLSLSVMRKSLDEQVAAIAALYNLSTEPGAVVPLTNTKNVVATLVHAAHSPETHSDVRIMACDALATLGLWLQTLAGAGTIPEEFKDSPPLPSYATSGWKRWD